MCGLLCQWITVAKSASHHLSQSEIGGDNACLMRRPEISKGQGCFLALFYEVSALQNSRQNIFSSVLHD